MTNQSKRKGPRGPKSIEINGVRFVVWFRHYITGNIIDARDYGYKAFPLKTK